MTGTTERHEAGHVAANYPRTQNISNEILLASVGNNKQKENTDDNEETTEGD
jgi:hypothetical protein